MVVSLSKMVTVQKRVWKIQTLYNLQNRGNKFESLNSVKAKSKFSKLPTAGINFL